MRRRVIGLDNDRQVTLRNVWLLHHNVCFPYQESAQDLAFFGACVGHNVSACCVGGHPATVAGVREDQGKSAQGGKAHK